MKLMLLTFLRKLGILRVDYLVGRQPVFPDLPSEDTHRIILVEDEGVQKWACLACPGGCGTRISLSLNPNRRPRWTILSDWLERPTVSPSVHQKNACGCHFWIKRGKVEWCRGGRPSTSFQEQQGSVWADRE